ncbi:MAG TPA: DUF4350 domain-containing protein [Chryseosolibacter sp.]|nr:DUF4350 domain-containing protein [Chryseosolibacter sp.]
MRETKVRIIVVIAFVTIAGVIYYIFSQAPKRHQWFESYRSSSEEPYGAAFIHKMLRGYRPGSDFMVNEKERLHDLLENVDNVENTDYILIGHNVFLDEASASSLARFIEAGGNAFIATLTPPEEILMAVYYQECRTPIEFVERRTEEVSMNFFHPDLEKERGGPYRFRIGVEDFPYSWDYISEAVFCDSTRSITPLGFQNDDHVNFVRISVGKGSLYLHSNPIAFTNYFLLKPENVRYAAGVFSHLDGEDIIWDEFSKIPLPGGRNNAYDSPLYYILQQPALKYSWWLLLFTVLLYVVFGGKRKQRVIPVLEPKRNTSLEFVNLISQLHYRNANHLDMAHKKMKYFLYFVRSKYGIHAERFREEHIRRLAEKSKVRLADVEVIFSRYYLIEERFKHNIEANRLVDLYDAIENFYKQSK